MDDSQKRFYRRYRRLDLMRMDAVYVRHRLAQQLLLSLA